MGRDTGESQDKSALVLRAGSTIINTKPVFTPNSQCLICASGQVIKVWSVTSGSCVRTLSGHRGHVTGLTIHPGNQYQLLSCSTDQLLIKWNYTDGVILKTYKLGAAVFGLLPTGRPEGTLLAVCKAAKQRPELISFTLPTVSQQKQIESSVLLRRCSKSLKHVAVGCRGEFVAAIFSKTLTICKLNSKNKGNREHDLDRAVGTRCVACHPSKHCVATGGAEGKITIWYDIFKERPVKTFLHWHALPVADLAFTAEGSYLLSGGHECVLVKWQQESSHKDTLPRLGAPITSITCSPDNTYYASCHADNVIQVMSSQLRVVQHYQGLTRACHTGACLPAGLLHDPRSNALVLNGRPGHLQFYCLNSDKHLYNLDIVQQNYISPENLKRPLVVTEVENTAFSKGGNWVATVERRDDGETSPEMRLKFWAYDTQSQNYMLNTSVDLPHEQPVTALAFRPTLRVNDIPMAVTASTDGRFKLWTLEDDTDIYRQNQCWQCESVGFYREAPATAACFSSDGSLLAVAFNNVLTLWDPDNNALKMTLTHAHDNSAIKHVLFSRGTVSHLLLCASDKALVAWNMLTTAVEWSHQCKVSVMVPDPTSENVAVFIQDHSLWILHPSCRDPIDTHPDVTQNDVTGAIFLPRPSPLEQEGRLAWQNRAQLYFMTSSQELWSIQPFMECSPEQETIETDAIPQQLPASVLSDLLTSAKPVRSNTSEHHEQAHKQPAAEYLQQMLLTPAHVLPPPSAICWSFLQQLATHKQTHRLGSMEDSSEDEDEDNRPPPRQAEDSESDMETDDVPSRPNGVPLSSHKPQAEVTVADDMAALDSVKPTDFAWLRV